MNIGTTALVFLMLSHGSKETGTVRNYPAKGDKSALWLVPFHIPGNKHFLNGQYLLF